MICTSCQREVAPGAAFCSACGQPVGAPYVPVQEAAAQAGLVRPLAGRMIAGVCAGFARRYRWDATIVRLVLVLAVLVGAGTPVLAYVVAWIVMPNEVWMSAPPAPVVPPPPAAAPTQDGPAGTMGV